MRTSVKVAVVQAAPVGFELEQSIEKMAIFTAEAASAGADLVVFPYARLHIYYHVGIID
jgi:predicted amidohydrolase